MIPLEDNVGDIIGKAQRGLGISDSELAEKAGVTSQQVRELREGDVDEAVLLKVAPILGLNGQALLESAKGEWQEQQTGSVTPIESTYQPVIPTLLSAPSRQRS